MSAGFRCCACLPRLCKGSAQCSFTFFNSAASGPSVAGVWQSSRSKASREGGLLACTSHVGIPLPFGEDADYYALRMGARKHSPQPTHQAFVPPCRNLSSIELAGVILGCTNTTEPECLRKGLFGLPSNHYSYVRLITPGLPLFLFNYQSRTLSGVFRATSNGGLGIDRTAWSGNNFSATRFPAQVQVQLWQQCPVLTEEVFGPILQANYYTKGKFLFELDTTQTESLLAEFGLKASPFTAAPAPPSPSPPLVPAAHCPLVVSPLTYIQPAAYTYPSFTPAPCPYYIAPISVLPPLSPIPMYSLPAQPPAVCTAPRATYPAAGTAFDAGVFTAPQSPTCQSLPKRRRISEMTNGAPSAWLAPQPFSFLQHSEAGGALAWEECGAERPSSAVATVLGSFYSRLQARASQFYEKSYRDRIVIKLLGSGGSVRGDEAVLRELVQEEVGKAHLTCCALVREVKAAALTEGLAALEGSSLEHSTIVQQRRKALHEGLARFEASGLAYVERAKEKGQTVIFTSNAHYLQDSVGKARARLRQRFGAPTTAELERAEGLQIKVGAYWKVLLKRLADEIPIELKYTLQQELKLSPDLFGLSDRGSDAVGAVASGQRAGRRKRKR